MYTSGQCNVDLLLSQNDYLKDGSKFVVPYQLIKSMNSVTRSVKIDSLKLLKRIQMWSSK